MAKIVEIKEIPLSALVIGRGQVRVRDVGKGIDELAASIKKQGLLQPIVVCEAGEPGKYEILTGQRRFLAVEALQKDTITACVLDQKVDEVEAKLISVTENLVRRDPNSKDYIDACTWLYRKYGSIQDVADELGLSYSKVALYVKYDRLKPEMRKLVDEGEVEMKTALRAQDAASVTGSFNAEEAVKLAKEMSRMSGGQQQRIVQKRKEKPEGDVDEVIEAAKSGEKITQIVITVGTVLHQRLKQYAKDEGTTMDDAVRTLIEEGLTGKGYSMEEE
jgi:ParB family chromosome partitioning protein